MSTEFPNINPDYLKIIFLSDEKIRFISEKYLTSLMDGSLKDLPDRRVLQLSGLIKKDGTIAFPEILSPRIMRDNLKYLLRDGTYSPEFIAILHEKVARRREEKISNMKSVKKILRTAKILSYALQAIYQIYQIYETKNVRGNTSELAISFLITAILWAIVDRLTIDPDERTMIQSIVVRQALEREFITPVKRPPPDINKLAESIFPDNNNDDDTNEILRSIYQKIEFILNTGYSYADLFKHFKLKRQSPKSISIEKSEEESKEEYTGNTLDELDIIYNKARNDYKDKGAFQKVKLQTLKKEKERISNNQEKRRSYILNAMTQT